MAKNGAMCVFLKSSRDKVKKTQMALQGPWLKFGLPEKHTKFEKIFLMVLTNHLISKHQIHEEDFFKLCVLLKKSKLYLMRL